jgi:hypothetical protein
MLVFGCMVVLLLEFWPARTTLPQHTNAKVRIARIFFICFLPQVKKLELQLFLRLKQIQVNIFAEPRGD